MSEPATPHVSRRPALPLIWVVPIVALVVAGWMIVRQFRNRGPEITLEFANGAGVEAGKTPLEHKGVIIGTVRSVSLNPDLTGVVMQVRLTKAGAAVARAGSQFWIVHPEVSLSGIHGLETLMTGVQLQVRPGNGPPTHTFRGLDRPPPMEERDAGRAFVLRADKLDGITPSAPVYYRGAKVGVVETTRLADDATAVLIRIRVYRPYADLVRTNTQFWNAGGLDFKLGIHGADLRADSLEALLAGAVAFATVDKPELGPPALDGTEFQLHEKAEKEWLEGHPQISIHPEDSTPDATKTGRAPDGAGVASHSGRP